MSMRSSFLPAGRRGLSIIELLIALSIVSFVGAVLYGTYSQGLNVWKRARDMQVDLDSDRIFEKIERDLANAFPANVQRKNMESAELQFYTIAAATREGAGDERLPARVTYRFDPEGGVLTRAVEDYRALLPASNVEPAAARAVAEKMRDIQFEYYHPDPEGKDFQWKAFWRGDCLPAAVRVSLWRRTPARAESVVKILPVPAGQLFCVAGTAGSGSGDASLPGKAAVP